MTNEYDIQYADDTDIEADEAANAPVFVASLEDIGLMTRNGRKVFHQEWEPLSFIQKFNREAYTFRKDDHTHDWITSHTNDGRLMGDTSDFGAVRAAWAAIGYPITKNDTIRPALLPHLNGGARKIFKVTRVRVPYASRESLDVEAQKQWGKPLAECSR